MAYLIHLLCCCFTRYNNIDNIDNLNDNTENSAINKIIQINNKSYTNNYNENYINTEIDEPPCYVDVITSSKI
jgi:hypothetical protein